MTLILLATLLLGFQQDGVTEVRLDGQDFRMGELEKDMDYVRDRMDESVSARQDIINGQAENAAELRRLAQEVSDLKSLVWWMIGLGSSGGVVLGGGAEMRYRKVIKTIKTNGHSR